MGGVIYSFSIIFGSLFFGYFIRKRNIIANTEELSKAIIKNTFRFISPIILCVSFWKLNLTNLSIWTLPFVGLATCTILLILSKYLAGVHKLNPKQTGSYITAAAFSNIGYTLGGFLCFILCGETGLALAIMYTLFYTPYFYTIGFYVARHYGQERQARVKGGSKGMGIEDIRLFPFIGLLLGVGLNLSRIPRPDFFAYVLKVLVPTATFGYFSSIGLTFSFSAVKRFKRVCFSISVLKFIVSPLVGFGLAYLMGYHRILEGLPMKIVLIESAMPVALSALLLTKFFDIDQDLANACWLVTTFMMVAIIPILINLLSVF
jgi:predicted permease